MKRLSLVVCSVALMAIVVAVIQNAAVPSSNAFGQEAKAVADPGEESVQRSRDTVATLDNIFKQTIVLITDKYVHDEDDFAAGSAAVLLFKKHLRIERQQGEADRRDGGSL